MNQPDRPHIFSHPTYGVFSSPNAESMPTFPIPRLPEVFDPLIPLRTLWADNRYVFLALMPLSPRLNTPPFDVIRSYTVIRHDHGGWGLTLDSSKRWCRLENNLINVAKICLANRNLILPLESQYPLPPNKFGYAATHRSEKGAKLALHKSRAAFLALMAWISYLIIGSGEYAVDRSVWLQNTLIKGGLSYDDVKAITESEIAEFSASYPRAGVIVDYTCRFEHTVRCFIRCHVPVWFFWGDCSHRYKIQLFGQYMPKPEELAGARWREEHRGPRQRQPHLTRTSAAPAAPAAPAPGPPPAAPAPAPPPSDGLSDYTASRSPSPSHNHPLPTPGYGQVKGETWREYFDRRTKIRDHVIANETESEREQRIQVEEARADFAQPGKKGSPVYRWKRNRNGFWIRTPVTRNQVSNTWQEYTNTQKRFDSILKQWDLCKELDSKADVEDEDDQDIYDVFMGDGPKSPRADSIPLPSVDSLPTAPLLTRQEGVSSRAPLPSTPSPSTEGPLTSLETGELFELPVSSSVAIPSWDSAISWREEDTFEMLPVFQVDDPHNLDGVQSNLEY